jgi:hypothetical protein
VEGSEMMALAGFFNASGIMKKAKSTSMWVLFALLAAFSAAVVTVLSKAGIKNVDSNLAFAIQSVMILIVTWSAVLLNGTLPELTKLDNKTCKPDRTRFTGIRHHTCSHLFKGKDHLAGCNGWRIDDGRCIADRVCKKSITGYLSVITTTAPLNRCSCFV